MDWCNGARTEHSIDYRLPLGVISANGLHGVGLLRRQESRRIQADRHKGDAGIYAGCDAGGTEARLTMPSAIGAGRWTARPARVNHRPRLPLHRTDLETAR